MATARDKLVADWRHELHAAQDALADSPQHAWLARMRVRLYRFLLRCYGKANWRTSPAPHASDGVVFDQPEARFLHGKPAKSAGKIQAVLKSVANAQTPVASGDYTGLAARSYIAIARESANDDTYSVFATLNRDGIYAQHVVREGEDVVEVRAVDLYRAQWLLSGYEAARRSRRGPLPKFVNEIAEDFGVALATAPFIGWFASMLFMAMTRSRENAGLVAVTVGLVWILIFVAFRLAQRLPRRN